MILYAAADLLWATKIKATAEAVGVAARPVRTIEMLEARLVDCPEARALVVDLEKGEDALALIRKVREREGLGGSRLKVLAWGPHVAKDLLQAARDAGADEVLTRGAFDHNLEQILLKLGS
ncbi:MAG: hypothetical protein U0640_16240 [Phycisphaerales bacterium]